MPTASLHVALARTPTGPAADAVAASAQIVAQAGRRRGWQAVVRTPGDLNARALLECVRARVAWANLAYEGVEALFVFHLTSHGAAPDRHTDVVLAEGGEGVLVSELVAALAGLHGHMRLVVLSEACSVRAWIRRAAETVRPAWTSVVELSATCGGQLAYLGRRAHRPEQRAGLYADAWAQVLDSACRTATWNTAVAEAHALYDTRMRAMGRATRACCRVPAGALAWRDAVPLL